ncbi:MAG: hypothetical protein IH614_14370, partial [Desulfuromonadales bacterium]|nr:hypothetical protein [Desulfuromonadales bacterium]
PFSWGDSEAALRGAQAPIVAEQAPGEGMKALFVNDTMAGLEAFAIYLLTDDRLVQTKYFFPQKHWREEAFLDDYARVEEALRQRYGQPLKSEELWRQGGAAERSNLGRMIAVGQVVLKSYWEEGETLITHVLRGENLAISHEVVYASKQSGKTSGKVMEQIRPPQEFRF